MKALTHENLLKAPLPTSVFPSYRTIKNIGELEHRKCDNCERKKKCEILCDGPGCNKGYCLKCLGFKTVPKRLLEWNTEADKPKSSSILHNTPRYRPFFAKFCHPLSEVDLPVTSNVRFVEKTVQKRPRKISAKSRVISSLSPEPNKKKKKSKPSSPAKPPTGVTAAERTVKRATSTARRWVRDNTSLTCLPSITHISTIVPNPLGIHEFQLTPNTLVKCPLVKHSTHRTPKFRVTIYTETNEISIKCLFGKCSSPSIKISIPPPRKYSKEQTKRTRSPSPITLKPSTNPGPSSRKDNGSAKVKSAYSSAPNSPTPNAASSQRSQKSLKKDSQSPRKKDSQSPSNKDPRQVAKRSRNLSPDSPQPDRRNPRRLCRNFSSPCTPSSTVPMASSSNIPCLLPCLSPCPCPSPCTSSSPSLDAVLNPPLPLPMPTDKPPP